MQTQLPVFGDPNLLVGNETADDAAVYDVGQDMAIISSTDFFTPIVDDPLAFGKIAAANAISDIYAMGGKPIMALAILAFPTQILPASVAQQMLDGARISCHAAGIALAGGHSIDSAEPIFGLAVTGMMPKTFVKRNATAQAGCELYLTKPLGSGILTTAQKRGKLQPSHQQLVIETMSQLNKLGESLAQLASVQAMTDVTGFGLAGHLLEMCDGANLRAELAFSQLPLLEGTLDYVAQGCIPGGTARNFESYGQQISPLSAVQKAVLCDPQTSGGLLVAIAPDGVAQALQLAQQQGVMLAKIGRLLPPVENAERIVVRD